MEKAKKNPIKIWFFKVVMQKCEKSKMDFFNCLTLFVSGREKKTHFRAHYLFWPKNFLGPKQCKPGKAIKIVGGFSGNCPKPKMTPFLGKRCFLTWVKKWVLLTVFLKSCVLLKTLFYSVFRQTQLFRNKICMLNKTENL